MGTKIIWTITNGDDGTMLTLLHQGLNKSFECYDVCEPAWDYFMKSIESFLLTGKGTPYHKQKAVLEWEEKEQSSN